MNTLLSLGVVPLINENDAVSGNQVLTIAYLFVILLTFVRREIYLLVYLVIMTP